MAQSEEEKLQASLFGELEKADVKVTKEAAEVMKENILSDRGSTNYLGLGAHDVEATSVELVKASTGTLGIKFNVENDKGRSDVTMWLSEGALPYTIENVSRLLVHNADEKNKEAARNHMSNVVSAKELYDIVVETMAARLKNKAPFVGVLVIAEDKSGRTYVDKNGETKPSLVRNFQTWKPKETAAQSVVAVTGGTVVSDKDTLNGLPF